MTGAVCLKVFFESRSINFFGSTKIRTPFLEIFQICRRSVESCFASGGVFENAITVFGVLKRSGVLLYLVEGAQPSLIASITE